VYRERADVVPVAGAQVLLIDSARRRFTVTTDCSGNFSVYPSDYEPP
jgi:hypothetical protein